jgi:hypothetical protein
MEKLPLLPSPSPPHLLLIHGGAGTIEREKYTPEQQARYRAALCIALQAARIILHLLDQVFLPFLSNRDTMSCMLVAKPWMLLLLQWLPWKVC